MQFGFKITAGSQYVGQITEALDTHGQRMDKTSADEKRCKAAAL